jgi:hypothetical protein
VKHNYYVEVFRDGVLITGFLISAVSEVTRISMDREFIETLYVLVSNCGVVSIVGRTVVEEKYLVDSIPNLFRNAILRPIKFIYGVVSNYK